MLRTDKHSSIVSRELISSSVAESDPVLQCYAVRERSLKSWLHLLHLRLHLKHGTTISQASVTCANVTSSCVTSNVSQILKIKIKWNQKLIFIVPLSHKRT